MKQAKEKYKGAVIKAGAFIHGGAVMYEDAEKYEGAECVARLSLQDYMTHKQR